MEELKIRRDRWSIIIEKDNNSVEITQTLDCDIWFSTLKDEFLLELNFSSRNPDEWETYLVFENLMKAIVGRYVLSGDYDDEWSMLPKDFIDLKSKTIIWHSDGAGDNILKLLYSERNGKKSIKLSISKDKQANEHDSNVVRVRRSGSSYGYYYKEFTQFFHQLTLLEGRLNPIAQPVQGSFGHSRKREKI